MLGTWLLSPRAAGVQGAIPAAIPGRLARIDGFAYVILSFTGILLPQYQDKVFSYGQPAFFGEVAFMLWLSIKGAKPPALDATALGSGPDTWVTERTGFMGRVFARFHGSATAMARPVGSSRLLRLRWIHVRICFAPKLLRRSEFLFCR